SRNLSPVLDPAGSHDWAVSGGFIESRARVNKEVLNMKRSNAVARQICWLVVMAGVAIFSPSGFGAGSAAATAITIVDQNGRLVPNAAPSTTGQIFVLTVDRIG